MKFGVEARRSRNHEFNSPTVSGAFSFSTQPTGLPGNAATGYGLASMMLGFPTGYSQNKTEELDRSMWYLAAFAQDDWSVTPSLTLNIGMRFETDTPIVDARDRMATREHAAAATPLGNAQHHHLACERGAE